MISKPAQTQQEKLRALLRLVRVEANMKQSQVAKLLGKPQAYISRYETGERQLNLIEIREICDAVGISLLEFVRRFEDDIKS